jgi:hypothetical protein
MQLNIIGEIIDTSIDAIISQFAKNPTEEQQIRSIYGSQGYSQINNPSSRLDGTASERMSFHVPSDLSLCRLYEVWEKKSAWRVHYHDYADGTIGVTDMSINEIAKINKSRIDMAAEHGIPLDEVALIECQKKYDGFWIVKYLAPNGECLFEGETPYEHKEHPYNISMFAIDGRPVSLIETIIDQQRYINRMMNFLDMTLGNSAKNAIFMEQNMIPDSTDARGIASEFSRVQTPVITYKENTKNPTAKPFVLSTNTSDVGGNNLLSMQLSLIEKISGVTSAIQGQDPKSGTPASLYAEQAQNATLNIRNGLDIFNALKEKRDKKVLKLIVQYYESGRMISNASMKTKEEVYDAPSAYGVETDLIVSPGTNTPAYRHLSDSILMTLFQMQAIDLKTFLSNSSLPNADSLLESIESREEEQAQMQEQMMAQQAMQGQIPENFGMFPQQPQAQQAQVIPQPAPQYQPPQQLQLPMYQQ